MGDPSDKASFHGAIILVVLIVVSLVVLLLSSTGKLLRHSSSSTTFAASLSQVPTTTTLSSSSSSLSATNLTAIARSGATTTTTTPSTYTTDTLSTSEFKVELRFPPTRVGQAAGKEEIIDLQSEEGNYDAGFVCKTFNVEKVLGPLHSQMDSHLVRVEPIVTEIQQYGSIVHHMDIFTCQDSVVQETLPLTTRSQQSDWCANDAFLETSCKQVIWVYDRGAKKFTFPKEAGILFGPNSGFTHLILQIHYLLPELYIKQTGIGSVETPSATTGQQRGMIDSSGFEMIFNTKLRPHDSSIFGFLDFSMVIPPKTSTFVFENHVDSVSLAKMIAPDLLEFGQVHPFAVHLHAHNYAKSVKLEHYRDGVMLRTYDEIEKFGGYGKDQTFRHLPISSESIRVGDSLTFVCTFSSMDMQRPIHYGVSHGDEMCAPLILYYPHVRGPKGQTNINMVGFTKTKTKADDVKSSDIQLQDLI